VSYPRVIPGGLKEAAADPVVGPAAADVRGRPYPYRVGATSSDLTRPQVEFSTGVGHSSNSSSTSSMYEGEPPAVALTMKTWARM
jgi:hypothetical protein